MATLFYVTMLSVRWKHFVPIDAAGNLDMDKRVNVDAEKPQG